MQQLLPINMRDWDIDLLSVQPKYISRPLGAGPATYKMQRELRKLIQALPDALIRGSYRSVNQIRYGRVEI